MSAHPFRGTLRIPMALALVASIGMCSAAQAEDVFWQPTSMYSVAGTGGVGLGLAKDVGQWTLRAAISEMRVRSAGDVNGLATDATIGLRSRMLSADYRLFSGSFHITGGIELGHPSADLMATPGPAGNLNIYGITYSLSSGDNVTGRVQYPDVMPYLGLGWDWDLRASGIKIGLDMGALIGHPDVSLQGSPGLRAIPGFDADLSAQERRIADAAARVPALPSFQVRLGYRF